MDLTTVILGLFFLPSLVYTFKKLMSKDIRDNVNNQVKEMVDEIVSSITPEKDK